MLFLLFAATVGQSAVQLQLATTTDGSTEFYMTNVRLGEPGTPFVFRLVFPPLPATLTVTANPHSTFFRPTADGGASDRLVFPSTKFEATFGQIGAAASVVALPSLAAEGVTLCDHELYIGAPPSACTSQTFASTLCDADGGCWYEVTRGSDVTLAVFNAELAVTPVGCKRAALTTATGSIDVCVTADNEFNPGHRQTSVYMVSAQHQVLYINDTGTSNLEGTIFAFGIVLVLIVWTAHSAAYVGVAMDLATTSEATVVVCDVVATVASASTFALIRSGVMFCPPETSQAVGHNAAVASVVLSGITIVAGAILTVILMFTALHVKIIETNRKRADPHLTILTGRVRCHFEVVLLLILHLHFPRAMGHSLRRTVGFFLGITAAIVVGRDSAARTPFVVHDVVYYAWAATALATIVLNLLLPITYVSAGFTNQLAPVIAVVLATASCTAGYLYTRTAKLKPVRASFR